MIFTIARNRKKEPIKNVLSLFDGISCTQIALNRLGIPYEKYYASEIEEASIKVTQDNYPNTIQLGDVTKVRGEDLPQIDLLVAGSPCQGFSMSGRRLNFDDSRSKLFFEFLRLLEETNPKYFLLENVRMEKWMQNVISYFLKIEPVFINSSVVSAQSRPRLYWTNLPIKEITPKEVWVKDILESNVTMQNFYGNTTREYIPIEKPTRSKGNMLFLGGFRTLNGTLWQEPKEGEAYSLRHFRQGYRVFSIEGKGEALTANGGGLAGKTSMYLTSEKTIRKLTRVESERMQTVPDNYTKAISVRAAQKALGNGFTVDIICEILSYLK